MVEKKVDALVVGKLAAKEEMEEGLKNVFLMNGKHLNFQINIISDYPKDIPKNKTISAFANIISGYTEKFDFAPNNIREAEFEEEVKDKFFVFQPTIREDTLKNTYLAKNIITMYMRPENVSENAKFISIPHSRSYPTFEFEERLLEQKAIGKLKYFDGLSEFPEYVIHANYLYGPFVDYDYTEEGIKLFTEEDGVVKKLYFNPNDYKGYIINHPDMLFVDLVFYRDKLSEWFNEHSEQVAISLSFNDHIPLSSKELTIKKQFIKESVFIDKLKRQAIRSGLVYRDEELINFHTSLKTGSLAILSGMSGMGKSKLVDTYAKALGIYGTRQYKMIPIQPNWTDDVDLLGYLDTMNNLYRPASSGLIDILIDAQTQAGLQKIYIICFDEMNLARIEHYFSQFISVLEMDQSDRVLTLYNPALKERVFNSEKYPPQIRINENVLFVGTVNIDESTHNISDKVLDRANLISLSDVVDSTGRLLVSGWKSWDIRKKKAMRGLMMVIV